MNTITIYQMGDGFAGQGGTFTKEHDQAYRFATEAAAFAVRDTTEQFTGAIVVLDYGLETQRIAVDTAKAVRMTVHHGNTIRVMTGTGNTINAAMRSIKSTRLGSYAPEFESPRFLAAVADLETTGKHSLGWADYEVIP